MLEKRQSLIQDQSLVAGVNRAGQQGPSAEGAPGGCAAVSARHLHVPGSTSLACNSPAYRKVEAYKLEWLALFLQSSRTATPVQQGRPPCRVRCTETAGPRRQVRPAPHVNTLRGLAFAVCPDRHGSVQIAPIASAVHSCPPQRLGVRRQQLGPERRPSTWTCCYRLSGARGLIKTCPACQPVPPPLVSRHFPPLPPPTLCPLFPAPLRLHCCPCRLAAHHSLHS